MKNCEEVLNKGEKLFFYLSLMFLGVLLIIQFLFLKDATRLYISRIDRMEGETVSFALPLYSVTNLTLSDRKQTPAVSSLKTLRESKFIVIKMILPNYSDQVFITVNGQTVGNFGKGDLKVSVFSGDYLEIDASSLQHPAQFIINVPNSGLLSPEDGLIVETHGNIAPIGKVNFK